MKRNNTLVAFVDEKVGKLENIVEINNSYFMMVYILNLHNLDTFYNQEADVQISHIRICNGEDANLTAIPVMDAYANCVEIIIDDQRYISKLPNYVSLN